MTDKKLINNFLNKNYKVLSGYTADFLGDFIIKDVISEKEFDWYNFNIEIKKIFGDIKKNKKDLVDYHCENWFELNKKKLIGDLNIFFSTLDKNKNVDVLIKDCHSKFKNFDGFSYYFIERNFFEFYNKKYLIPKLDKYLETFNHYEGSEVLILDLIKICDVELPSQITYAIEYLNNWYYNNIFKHKIKNFLDETTIVLGKIDWEVKNNVFGNINRINPSAYFKYENNFQKDKLNISFSEWYFNKQEEITKKELKYL